MPELILLVERIARICTLCQTSIESYVSVIQTSLVTHD